MVAWILLVPSPVLAIELGKFSPLLYMALALLVGAFVIVLVAKWRRSTPTLGPSASDQLAQYRLLYEQGAISEEEYKKLRTLLGGELRKVIDAGPVPGTIPPAGSDSVQAKPNEPPPPETGVRPS